MRAAVVPALLLASASALIARPEPVTSVNLTKYFGRWYQMQANSIELITYENHSLCETADCE